MHIVEPRSELATRPVSARRAWWVVLLLTIAYLLSFIDRQILSLLIGPIRNDLHISDTQFGLLNGLAFSIFYATMGIPIAGLADRSSRPRIIVAGIALWSAATILCGFARSFLHLFISRIWVGAGEAALSPSAYSLIADLFPREKLGRALAVYSLGSLFGTGIAFLLGGLVIAAVSQSPAVNLVGIPMAPWQLAFILVGAPGLLLMTVIGLVVAEPRTRAPARGPTPSTSDLFRELVRVRAVYLPLMLGFSLSGMILFGLLGWTPAYLMRTYALSPRQVGLLLGPIAMIAGGGGNLTSGWLVDRMSHHGVSDAPFRVGMIGAVGVGPPIALIGFPHDEITSVILLVIAFFFASFPIAPSTAIMQIAAPPAMRSRVSAFFLFCNSFIGLALGSALIGLVNDQLFGGQNIGAALGAVLTVATLAAALILNRGRRPFAWEYGASQNWPGRNAVSTLRSRP